MRPGVVCVRAGTTQRRPTHSPSPRDGHVTADQESTLTTSAVTLGEVGRAVIRIERKLDGLADDHETRLRAVERSLWAAAGLGGAGLASGLGALIQSLLRHA